MDFDSQFDIVCLHVHRGHGCDFAELKRDLGQLRAAYKAEMRREQARFEQLQAEMAELLRRIPDPDTVPARVVVTVH